jgi:hypothetical protein
MSVERRVTATYLHASLRREVLTRRTRGRPPMTPAPATAVMDAPHDPRAMPPTTTVLVPRPRRLARLLHVLRLALTSGTRHHGAERPWLSPDPTPGDTLTALLARHHPHLYIDVLHR